MKKKTKMSKTINTMPKNKTPDLLSVWQPLNYYTSTYGMATYFVKINAR